MTTDNSSAAAAAEQRSRLPTALLLGLLAFPTSGCAYFQGMLDGDRSKATAAAPAATPAPATVAAAPPPPPPKPFPEAVGSAAQGLLSTAAKSLSGTSRSPRYPVVIDPLVDGVTGAESVASRGMGKMLAEAIARDWPQFEVVDFNSTNVARSPLVLVGTFTGLNAQRQPIGQREMYRICLSLADLSTGKVVAKGLAFALKDGVDATPTVFFQDSPAWRNDARTDGYIKTCQGPKAGDPIHPAYIDGILAATFVADGIEAYEVGRYQEALELYNSALQTSAGDQLRVYNGIYLANWRLGQKAAAADAYGQIIDYGLRNGQLGVKLLFKPGSTAFFQDPRITGPYPVWLEKMANIVADRKSCIEITGHTSPSGSPALNERLSLLRAEHVRAQLIATRAELDKRTIAAGVGSAQNIIGTGADDVSDTLDRRVEFKPIAC